jgi:capsular polysaccharide transport system permease protein
MMNTVIDKVKSSGPLFWITVLIPTTLAILYYGFFASDVYVSESQFVVRSPDKPSTTGLGMLLKSSGFANAGDEIYAAQSYVLSRDALQALNQHQDFAKAYGSPSISAFDRYNASGLDGNFEDLYKYYKKKISVEHDTTSSIITLEVRSYTPVEAYRFNKRLLEMAEATVNKLNTRGRQDLIRFAQTEVDEAKKKAQDAAVTLAAFRNRQGVVDPEKQATIQLQMISKLQDELISTRTQLRELRAFAPQNPQIEALETRIKGISAEIADQSGLVAGGTGSLSSKGAQYQRLLLDNQFAEKQLASAMASLEDARNEARRKQAYVERIVEPNTPDEALEPRRLRGIFSTLILGLAAWAILSMLLAGMLEHKD